MCDIVCDIDVANGCRIGDIDVTNLVDVASRRRVLAKMIAQCDIICDIKTMSHDFLDF